jgi:uncharacterized RmlC-like cupin family protein
VSGVTIIRPSQRDTATAQTPGMDRAAGVSASTCNSASVWMGAVRTDAGFRSGAHHHGGVESALYVVSGRYRFRWGERLEHSADGEAGDFIFVPPMVLHQEINLSPTEPLIFIVARGSQENVVVNVEMPEADQD